jgi:hypothetical protein
MAIARKLLAINATTQPALAAELLASARRTLRPTDDPPASAPK